MTTKKEEGTITATVNGFYKSGPIETRVFPEGVEAAFVRVSKGRTVNLGNYESLRVDVAVALPCLPEEVEEAVEQAESLSTQYLEEFIRREAK